MDFLQQVLLRQYSGRLTVVVRSDAEIQRLLEQWREPRWDDPPCP